MHLRAVFRRSRHNKNDTFNGMVLSIGRGVDNVELIVVFGIGGFGAFAPSRSGMATEWVFAPGCGVR